ncbi:MAG: sulfatase-like hydrolase/transferase [Chloroflexota bacterium]
MQNSPIDSSEKRQAGLLFWMLIFALNFLLFLPIFLFYNFRSDFFPTEELKGWSLETITAVFFEKRFNLDIFRFQLEWLLLILAWVWLKPLRKKWVLVFIFVLYIAQLIYMIYEGFIRSFYLLEPAFFNDYFLFADLTQFVVKNLDLTLLVYGLSPLLLVIIITALYRFFVWLLYRQTVNELTVRSKILFTLFCGFLLFSISTNEVNAYQPEAAISSFTAKIGYNFILSKDAQANANRFDKAEIASVYNYADFDLEERPDIYLIFIESYGSVLYQRSDFLAEMITTLRDLDAQLAESGWSVASNMSDAPTWGGGSWISYTSALSGVRLETHAEYLTLLNQYYNEPYPHLINYLRDQGYRSYRLSSISRELDDVQLDRYKDFYGFDEWLRFGDLNYTGPLYGWGPSPPDQYALHFAHEYMNNASDDPNLFFYISQNSHYPWYPLPTVEEDWRSFNDMPPVDGSASQSFSQEELRQNYMRSIQYELETLTNFILTVGDDNDIFVLVGDHQPARVARRDDGFDTPIHVISRNSAFVELFLENDFLPQLSTRGLGPNMHHEGFYSLFMQQLIHSFGESQLTSDALPVYSPSGLIFEKQE